MTLFLTDDQKQALHQTNGSTRLVDPDTGVEYVLMPAADYDAVREAVEEEKFLKSLAKMSAKAVGDRLKDEPWPQ